MRAVGTSEARYIMDEPGAWDTEEELRWLCLGVAVVSFQGDNAAPKTKTITDRAEAFYAFVNALLAKGEVVKFKDINGPARL